MYSTRFPPNLGAFVAKMQRNMLKGTIPDSFKKKNNSKVVEKNQLILKNNVENSRNNLISGPFSKSKAK